MKVNTVDLRMVAGQILIGARLTEKRSQANAAIVSAAAELIDQLKSDNKVLRASIRHLCELDIDATAYEGIDDGCLDVFAIQLRDAWRDAAEAAGAAKGGG